MAHERVFWFNRMVEHWGVPQRLDLVEQVQRGRLQVVQMGTFGPQFYGLAGDAEADRHWAGMPLLGVRENLDYVAGLIPRLQEAGAQVVGQMSMAWHYGDHEQGKGLFGAWEEIWTDDLLGPAPGGPEEGQQRVADGSLRRWPIPGRPYQTYSGCFCNPHWLAVLKPMVRKAIELGVDGFNVHHNFESFCACRYCRECLRRELPKVLDEEELGDLFGTAELEEVADFTPREESRPELKQRLALEVARATQRKRKEAFDEVFIDYGRSLNPDLLLAQWYHKYDFKLNDERSLLPAELWARDEDYIWYSQGTHKGLSGIAHGYLADMGLPSRFVYAAGGGRPFVINKYDFRRWRLSIAEAGANHAAAPAFHWGQDGDENFAVEDYLGPVLRYHRFLADQERFIHPAQPWSQVGLVYPRRAELEQEVAGAEPLKRIGRLLEDAHIPFDILLDEQLRGRIEGYEAVILPEIERLAPEEIEDLDRYVRRGGKVIFSGTTGTRQVEGQPQGERVLDSWRRNPPHGVVYLPEVPCQLAVAEIRPGMEVPVYPPLAEDAFGQKLLRELEGLLGTPWVETDAPWFVRLRAWRPEAESALVLHWVNYHQDEDSAIEVPYPVGPLQVSCRAPEGHAVERLEWLYPEMAQATPLEHQERKGRVHFTIPRLIVYGLSVLYLRPN